MRLKEFYSKVKDNNEEVVVFIRYGNFYRCYYNDAYIVSYLFDYKLSDKKSTGFPICNIDKVLSILKNNNISCIVINDINNVINYICINNKYNSFLDLSKKNYTLNEALFSINKEAKELLIENINNYNIIINFIRNIQVSILIDIGIKL